MDDRVELTEDVRKKLLGQYLFIPDYRSGDIIRVVGFTKKKVIIEQMFLKNFRLKNAKLKKQVILVFSY